jgi:diacylglycerol kinase family enzyme
VVRVTLFHNPSAGDAPLTADQLTSILSDAGYQVRYQSTKDDLSAALEDVGELAIVAGGDGTVAKVARALADTDIPLAVLPLGTANNIGKALGVFGDVRDIVAGWAEAPRIGIDVGVVSGPFGEQRFLEAVGAGVLAELIRRGSDEVDDTSAIVHRETDRALQLLASILRNAEPADIKLELDDHDLSGRYVGVEVMNVGFAGPNIPLAADADPADGALDLVLLREDDRERLLKYAVSRVESASAVMPSLDVRRGKRVRLAPPVGWPIHVDDEVVELDSDGAARIVDILLRPGVVQVVGGRHDPNRR